jgi:hypothetical protein
MRGKKHIPTPADRNTVKSMAACGFTHDQIAKCVGFEGIDSDVLRRKYRKELDTSMIQANAAIANKAYGMAMAGNTAMVIFWLKTRLGWKETTKLEHSGPDGGRIPLEYVDALMNEDPNDDT